MSIPTAPSPEEVSSALRGWLTDTFGGTVADVEAPARAGGGFDFWIYFVRFTGPSLPAEWTAPLVARISPSPARFPHLQRESRLQAWAAEQGYPAPAVLTVLEPGVVFASPVQVVQRVPGVTMTAAMTSRPWLVRSLLGRLGALEAQLHTLPVPDWGNAPEWSIVDRRLGLVRHVVESSSQPALARALEQVDALRSRLGTTEPVVCHGDFHPMNLLVDGDHASVIDWTDAGVGDRHADISRTAWLFRFASVASPHRSERAVLRALAPLLARRFLSSYRRHHDVDRDRIRLWMPLHLLHAWAMGVADELELAGPSRAGQDLRAGLAGWARGEFESALRAVP